MTDFLTSLPAHLLAIVLLAVVPSSSAAAFRLLRERDAMPEEERLTLYRSLVLSQWVLAAWGVVAVVLVDPAGFIRWWGIPQVDPALLLAVALALVVIGGIIWEERHLEELPELLRPVEILLPRSGRERRSWLGVSATAGVCEEILYRGFLFWYLLLLFPELGPFPLLALASVLFGLGHLYQGGAGVLATGAIGVILGAFYLTTGSLWIPILLHMLADARMIYLKRGLFRAPPSAPGGNL